MYILLSGSLFLSNVSICPVHESAVCSTIPQVSVHSVLAVLPGLTPDCCLPLSRDSSSLCFKECAGPGRPDPLFILHLR